MPTLFSVPERVDSSRTPTRVLVTGFGPFPGIVDNPSASLALAIANLPKSNDFELWAEVLPTTWQSAVRFSDRLAVEDPDVLVMLGVAARRRTVCVESLAFSEMSAQLDAAGQCAPRHRTALPASVNCAASTDALVQAMREAGVKARISRDPGRYICNALAYAAYRHAADNGRPLRAVFVHIPLPNSGDHTLAALTGALSALIAELARQARRADAIPDLSR